MKVPFSQVPVGQVFKSNDENPFSSGPAGSWFYFGQNDLCVI